MAQLEVTQSEFRASAARMVSLVSDYLAQMQDVRAYPQVTGAQTLEAFQEPAPEQGLRESAFDALETVIDLSRAPSPRFFGYVLGSGEPIAALADLLASVLNQNVTAWRSAPAAVTIERQVVRWIADAVGCASMTGSLCGGGSSANLMALAMARESRLPANDDGARPGVIYASSEAHMSIAKAVALLGIGRRNLHAIEVDDRFRLDVAALKAAIEKDRNSGLTPIAVVASAGTVSTGAIDPLQEIAAVCREYGLWMHVDGAYGVPAALVAADKFRGLNAADSLSLDCHKWLYQPVDCGLLLFKDPASARRAFSHTGVYAQVLTDEPEEQFAFFDESLELSRRFRALKIWLSLRFHGLDAFRAAVDADLEHARQLADAIRTASELELLAPVELSAVCFRFRDGRDDCVLDDFNAQVLRRVIGNGRVYLSNASIRGRFALRACFVNHRTQPSDVAQIVPEVLQAAREVAAGAARSNGTP
jgi:glutamate/tyrosine decarboxylase-like PLP-dependent enzyme